MECFNDYDIASLGMMQKTENGCYHKGFYILGSDKIDCALVKIKNPRWKLREDLDDSWPGELYTDASIFRMGSCELFSRALNKGLGLTAYELKHPESRECEIDDGALHCFCISLYKGQRAFVDIRGITTDIHEFSLGLPLEGEVVCVKQNTGVKYSALTKSEQFGYDFAEWILDSYKNLYVTDAL